jgi:hypothetical protein
MFHGFVLATLTLVSPGTLGAHAAPFGHPAVTAPTATCAALAGALSAAVQNENGMVFTYQQLVTATHSKQWPLAYSGSLAFQSDADQALADVILFDGAYATASSSSGAAGSQFIYAPQFSGLRLIAAYAGDALTDTALWQNVIANENAFLLSNRSFVSARSTEYSAACPQQRAARVRL